MVVPQNIQGGEKSERKEMLSGKQRLAQQRQC